ncbi:hypothetical protein GcM1_215073 [Golovinomyces cichoracearum]|uniref:Uncharacterized protein n=1 Tax=Golovinomyces cichoracearum TaxID=62708 RepID=A0A420IU02_9PEZI|nr:hypothetical protein GcM1_215073 [Golovinomyces cichoracearum]
MYSRYLSYVLCHKEQKPGPPEHMNTEGLKGERKRKHLSKHYEKHTAKYGGVLVSDVSNLELSIKAHKENVASDLQQNIFEEMKHLGILIILLLAKFNVV